MLTAKEVEKERLLAVLLGPLRVRFPTWGRIQAAESQGKNRK